LAAQTQTAQFDTLLSRLKNRISVDTTLVAPYFQLADTYRYAGRLPLGQHFFDSALRRSPKRSSLLAGRALVAKYQSQWADCFDFGSRALLSGSESQPVLDLTVECGVQGGQNTALAAMLRKLKRNKSKEHLFDLGYAIWRLRIRSLRRASKSIATYLAARHKDAFGHQIQGQIFLRTGDNEAAVKAFLMAEQLRPNTALNRIDALAGLAESYRQMDRSDSSLYFTNLACRLAEDNGSLIRLVALRQQQKDLYFALELPGKAEEACAQGIEAAAVLGDSVALGQFYWGLGSARAALKDLDMALQYLRHALQLAKMTGQERLLAAARLELGQILVGRSRPEAAAHYFKTGYEQALRGGLPDIAHQLLLALADLERDEGNRQGANDKYRTVLKYSQRVQRHALTEKCFLRLSNLYESPPQDVEGASYFLNLADALTRQTSQLQFAANHRWLQGNIAWSEGQVEEAETRFLQAMKLGAESGSHLACLAGQAGLVRTYLNADFADMAATQADSGLTYLSKFYGFGKEEEASQYFDLKNNFFAPAISAFAQAGDLGKIYQAGEQYNAIRHYLNIAPARHQIHSAKIDSVNLHLEIISKSIRSEMDSLLHLWKNRTDGPELVEQKQERIRDLYVRYHASLVEVAKSDPMIASLMTWQTCSLPDLQTKLAELRSTYIQYFVGETAAFVSVVSANDIICKRLNVTSTHLQQLIMQMEPALVNGHADDFSVSNLETAGFRVDKAAQLYQILFKPIRDLLSPGTALIISPSGVLNRIPFEVLVRNPQDLIDNYDYKNARFLVEAFPISYVPSAAALQTPKAQFLPRADILLVDGHDSGMAISSGSPGMPSAVDNDEKLADRITSALDVTILDTREVQKETFATHAGAYEFLHLSVPGSYSDSDALYTRLCFGNDLESKIQVKDLLDMHLNGRLAIVDRLTRNPSEDAEQDGSGTILHAFSYAGVPAVILSLWDQAPEARTAIETNLYANLSNGLSKAQALQQAKISVLTQGHRDPLTWASLMLYGDPRPVLIGSSHTDRIVYSSAVALLALVVVLVARIARKYRRQAG